jgi:hypothetical protein
VPRQRVFYIPIVKKFLFLFYILFLFNSSDGAIYYFNEWREAFVRNCYYRLITEILVCSGHNVAMRNNNYKYSTPFVVVGNPGIGKSSLSYLFIRTLMELGVGVYFFSFNYLLFFFSYF